jgi:hypothetical protein
MHARLVSYLRDNRDQIIESWLTEADLPAPAPEAAASGPANNKHDSAAVPGVAPFTFFEQAFDAVLQVIQSGDSEVARDCAPQLGDFLGQTCECRARTFGGRVCMELHDSGMDAFLSVFHDEWDVTHEFSELDREICAEKINHALSGFFGHEVEHCPHKETRYDCPFSAHLPGNPAS